jgi:hypothetical protein
VADVPDPQRWLETKVGPLANFEVEVGDIPYKEFPWKRPNKAAILRFNGKPIAAAAEADAPANGADSATAISNKPTNAFRK